jgi:hypothetical protein
LIAEVPSRPLGRKPQSADGDGEHYNDLTDEKFGGRHGDLLSESGVAQMPENENRLYLRSRRHLYAYLQIRLRTSANDA